MPVHPSISRNSTIKGMPRLQDKEEVVEIVHEEKTPEPEVIPPDINLTLMASLVDPDGVLLELALDGATFLDDAINTEGWLVDSGSTNLTLVEVQPTNVGYSLIFEGEPSDGVLSIVATASITSADRDSEAFNYEIAAE